MAPSSQNPVVVNISLSSPAIQQKGFGRGLILGQSNRFTAGALFGVYTSAASMLVANGGVFMNSDPEYLAAVAYFSQPIAPPDVMIGYATADVAQVETITPTAVDLATYTVTIDGIVSSFTAGAGTSAALIVTGLKAAIAAQSPTLPVVTSGSTTLIITSAVAGEAFTCSVGTNLVKVDTTPDAGPDTALTAIVAQGGINWFGLVLAYPSRVAQDILDAAAWIQATPYAYIFCASSSESGVLTNSSTDTLSQLQALSYSQTFYLWSDSPAASHPDAAWLGAGLAQTPGSWNYNYKSLVGVTPTAASVMTATAITNLNAKNGNYYSTYGGYNITQGGGVMASGQFIDVIVGAAWIKFTMQAAVLYVQVNTPKVSFDNDGIELLTGNAIRPTLAQAITNNIIAPGTVNIPLITGASFTSSQKSTRTIPALPWSAQLAGAINNVTINGNITA